MVQKKQKRDVEQALFTTFEEDGIYHIQCSGLVPGPGHVYAHSWLEKKKQYYLTTALERTSLENMSRH